MDSEQERAEEEEGGGGSGKRAAIFTLDLHAVQKGSSRLPGARGDNACSKPRVDAVLHEALRETAMPSGQRVDGSCQARAARSTGRHARCARRPPNNQEHPLA